MALNRRIYSSQSLSVPTLGVIPIKSVSISRERPMEPLMVMGYLKGANQQQKGFETFKVDVKTYLTSTMTDGHFKTLFSNTEKGVPTSIELLTQGAASSFKGNVVLTSLNIDSTVADFIEVSLSFQGLGNPEIAVNGNMTPADAPSASRPADNVAVLDSSNIAGSIDTYGTTIKSLKFSFEMPVETMTNHKAVMVGNSTAVMSATTSTLIAKAPYKSSLNLEGQSLSTYQGLSTDRGATLDQVKVGAVNITLINGALKSFSINQSPGEIGAAYSSSYEGTHVKEFSSITYT